MKQDRWQRIKSIFGEALDLSGAERAKLISNACKGDVELEKEIRLLLSADACAGSFLEASRSSTIPSDGVTLPLLSTGDVLAGRFAVVRLLGQGGMGQVYEAFDSELKSRVAIKVLRSDISTDSYVLARFRQEVQLARKITHPNVCRVFDIERHTPSDSHAPGVRDVIFLTMELLEGETLEHTIQSRSLAEHEVLPLVLQMSHALMAAHESGVVHRDFKPSNILLVSSDKGIRVVVTDFGLARAFLSSSTSAASRYTDLTTGSQQLLGTLVYMAPEQLQGHSATVASDIYSLGLVVYEMLTGRRPFASDVPFTEAARRLKESPQPPSAYIPGLNPLWDKIILRSLAPQPEKRFGNTRELVDCLNSYAATIGEKWKTNVSLHEPKTALRFWKIAASLACLLLAVAVGLGLVLKHWRAPASVVRVERTNENESAALRSSIAVLPFSDMTGEKELEYLPEGLTDELIGSLTNIDGIRVVSRISSFSFRNTHLSLRQIADILRVRHLVQGAVYKEGATIRVTVNLIDSTDDRNVWSSTYQRNVNDIHLVHAQITKAIAQMLRGQLTNDQVAQMGKQYTDNTEAYRLYLRGRHHWRRLTPDEIKEAITYFEQAVKLDDHFALAFSGIADAYSALNDYGGIRPSIALTKARLAAERAVALDNSLAEAHASLGLATSLSVQPWRSRDGTSHNWTEAEASFLKAIRLSPGYGPTHQWYAAYLAKQGRVTEAIKQIEFALDRDPVSIPVNNVYGWMLFFGRQYDLAIHQAEQTLDLDKTFRHSHFLLARIYEQQGRFNEAVSECNMPSPQDDDTATPASVLASIYASTGRLNQAQALIAELQRRRSKEHFPASYIASIYSRLGDKDSALSWLQTAYDENDSSVLFVKVHPDYDGLRSDPRYSSLLKELHLTENDTRASMGLDSTLVQ